MMESSLKGFLSPLAVDLQKLVTLSRKLEKTYRKLAAEAENQFLPTPISDSILRPVACKGGRYLAIDIGGTNLRVAFVELSAFGDHLPSTPGNRESSNTPESRVQRRLEKSWPIGNHLKNEQADHLFDWIGTCIAEVVEDGKIAYGNKMPAELSMGVTFSFPMIQHTLSDATLMAMGKGFAITSNLDLGKQLHVGYTRARKDRDLPEVTIVAIVNDAVATFVSFVYQMHSDPRRQAAMGLIVGTGNNATIPLKISQLHPNKREIKSNVTRLPVVSSGAMELEEEKIVINTEWSINGSIQPVRELGLVARWDEMLDAATESPGFMPFEYMSAGGYLGELGRLTILDYLKSQLEIRENTLPRNLRTPNGLTTTFLGLYSMVDQSGHTVGIEDLAREIPPGEDSDSWKWTPEAAEAFDAIGKAIQVRAAGMTAAAILGLLACAEEISLKPEVSSPSLLDDRVDELIVGYTGGCIVNFRDYLADCQQFLDDIMESVYGDRKHPRVVLQSCHDGGVIGAGILAGTVENIGTRSG